MDDDDFDEYDPHPYRGGYDIALTYGPPLPPSSTTCYPLSDALHSAVDEPPTDDRNPPLLDHRNPPQPADQNSPLLDHRNPPQPADQNPPPPDNRNPPPPEPYSSDSFDDRNPPPPEPYSSDSFPTWPPLTTADEERCRWRDQTYEPCYWNPWNQWRRAADYLFGYSHGYGERRIGIDSYGIPIYANKRVADPPLVGQIEPPRSHRLDLYDASGHEQVDPILYETGGRRDDIHVQQDPMEPRWYQNNSYNEVYREQVHRQPEWSSSYNNETVDEFHFSGTPNYAYDKHYSEEPLHVQVETIEPNSFQKPRYYDVYQQEHASHETNWHSSSYGEPPEPFEPTWSREPSSYGIYDEEPSSDSKLLEEWRDVYGNPSYDYERNYRERPLSDQLEPFKPTWFQNPILYGLENEEMFPKFYSGNESNEEITAQFFFPLNKYPEY